MHLIVEANNERELAKAMKGFLVRVAKALNVKALIRRARARVPQVAVA
jgi:hypothetical protein